MAGMKNLLGAVAAGVAGYQQGKMLKEDAADRKEARTKRGQLIDAQIAHLNRSAPASAAAPVSDPMPLDAVSSYATSLTSDSEDEAVQMANGGMVGVASIGGPRAGWQGRNFKKAGSGSR